MKRNRNRCNPSAIDTIRLKTGFYLRGLKIVKVAVENIKTEIAHLMTSNLVPERKPYSANKI